MKYLDLLKEGDRVSEVYLCKSKQQLKTKAGKSYYSLVLQDKSGMIDGKIWELGSGIDHFDSLDYIMIDGDVTSFQGGLQLNIRRVRCAGEGEYIPADYLPVSSRDIKVMYTELIEYIKSFTNPHLKKLATAIFIEDKVLAKTFANHSAAKSVHHGFVGGLLEHTLGIVELCDFLSSKYTLLNRDLLLCAAMLHDIGKIKELSAFPENDYTDAGQLLGHIMIGTEIINDKIRDIKEFPEVLSLELKHCILAHHGELEYGSPKKPALAEAVALSMADNLDAKLETLKECFANAEGTEWLGYNRLFESNIRKTTM